MFNTLRNRLVVTYAGLALLSVVLATGASLLLFGRSLDEAANREMVTTAVRLGSAITAMTDDAELLLNRRALGFLRPRGEFPGEIVFVDAAGEPLSEPRLAQPELLAGRYPPPQAAASDRPEARQTTLPSGLRVSYVSVLLPVAAFPGAADDQVYLTLVRPAREVRGLWRGMFRPVVLVGTLSVALALLLALWLARTITRPVEDLTRASERMAGGDYDVRVPVHRDDEIGHLAATFNTMSQEVGEAHRRQRDFVANVSHDLRTPLTSVRGYAGALVDGTAHTDQQRRQAARAIDEAAARMTALVNTLLELARLEGHQAGLQLAPTELDDVLRAVMAAAEPEARRRQVRVEPAGAAGLAVQADATWLVRALGNVVENAVHYSPVGGAVRLVVQAAGNWVTVVVHDDGPGIPAGDLPRVFERFYRGDKARPAGGSGLGLAIAREIIEAHGGDIAIASPPGAGTTVTVRLPKASGAPTVASDAPGVTATAGR